VASSVRTTNGLGFLLIGILFPLKKISNSFMIYSLNCLLNGPTYETKAEANKTSPMITLLSSTRSSIDCFHLSCSEPRAFTRRWARSSFLSHLAASSIAVCFSFIALSKLAIRIASFSLRPATRASTFYFLSIAVASCSSFSLTAILIGSTDSTTS